MKVKFRWNFLYAFLGLAVLSACVTPVSKPVMRNSSTELATKPAPARSSSRVMIQAWFREARIVVENDRNIDLSDVSLSILSHSQIPFALTEYYGRSANPSMSFDTRMRMFAGSALRDARNLEGFYDPYSKRVVINEDLLDFRIGELKKLGIKPRKTALTLLIHELIHAADDQQYNVNSIGHSIVGDKLGLNFVAEGHAEMHTRRLCVIAGCSDAYFKESNVERMESMKNDPYIVGPTMQRQQLIYHHGREFLTALNRRDPTGSLVEAALRNPPGDVVDFFTPEKYPNRARKNRRDSIYRALDKFEFGRFASTYIKVPMPAFDLAELPQHRGAQRQYMVEYGKNIIASGMMLYSYEENYQQRSINISIYQGANLDALLRKKQRILDKRVAETAALEAFGVGVHYPSGDTLDSWSEGLSEDVQRYVVSLTQKGSGETVTLYHSLVVEGDYLVSAFTVNDNSLNISALTAARDSVRSMMSGERISFSM